MDYILYLLRAISRKLVWIILGTVLVTILVYLKTAKMRGTYDVETTLYTGVVSGYGIEANNVGVNWAIAQNAIDNLINIIQSDNTLKRVSMRLFARILVKGSPDKDQNGISAGSYRYTYDHMKNSPHGKELVSLIDKSSEDKTMENFIKYEKPDINNYVYGLFYYQHPYYSREALKRIRVARLGNSDLLRVSYSSGDPGISYNTIDILMKEFVNEYRILRYGETDKVIEYFRSELQRIGNELTKHEDDLTKYNVDNRIINYYDETKEIAAINKEFELREQTVMFAYNSSKAMLEELERQMDSNAKQAITNMRLIEKLKEASALTGQITEMEMVPDEKSDNGGQLKRNKDLLAQTRKELSQISNQYVDEQYTANGVARTNIVEQWLDQILLYEKAKAELEIVKKSRIDLNDKYQFYAPVGTTIKRKERVINFSEQSYLTNLASYNEALMRKKNLEMTSAALKVLNPPAFPISPGATNRRKIVYMACFGTFLLLTGLFMLIELTDRTLRDSQRVFKLTKCPILGDMPNMKNRKSAPCNPVYDKEATRSLSSAILRFFTHRKEDEPYILNLLSTEEGCGKSFVGSHIESYWKSLGLNVRRITDGSDFDSGSSEFQLARNVNDIYARGDEDILIVEYPSLGESNIPTPLLREAQLNLMIVSADHGWRTTDKILLAELESQIGSKPYLCLNRAPIYDIENFTGMLPPYTLFRNISYRLSQFAWTQSIIHWRDLFRKKQNNSRTTTTTAAAGEDDDD